MEISSMVIGGLSGLVLFGLVYTIIGSLKTKKKVAVHEDLLQVIARENTTEHEKINYKMEASTDALRMEVVQMVHEMHAKLDRIVDVLQTNMNNMDTDHHSRIDQVYRDMDSRLDKMEARLTKKSTRSSKKEKEVEQLNS